MYVCMFVSVCRYICMYVCMYVCIFVQVHTCMCVCLGRVYLLPNHNVAWRENHSHRQCTTSLYAIVESEDVVYTCDLHATINFDNPDSLTVVARTTRDRSMTDSGQEPDSNPDIKNFEA